MTSITSLNISISRKRLYFQSIKHLPSFEGSFFANQAHQFIKRLSGISFRKCFFDRKFINCCYNRHFYVFPLLESLISLNISGVKRDYYLKGMIFVFFMQMLKRNFPFHFLCIAVWIIFYNQDNIEQDKVYINS